jgi:H+/gluconate symporter-like permease
MLDPLVILLIGIVTVIGMIIVFRVNAFIALITAAMLVSLLAAGALGEKIVRVAGAFGKTAGDIGIVIAMAAVIGKCLMDSGAADKIVRSFLRVLGEKRASVALLGSGFVLSIPVFFDTVFYLLVPLARSLWRRTNKNYVLYVCAIGAGGAITHTLVPPTPGPLVMAETLKIDVGMMIMIGTLVGLPMAVVGLVASRVMNRLMDIPMRPYSGEPEPEPLPDDQLPALWISLAPVLLPVIMISANTVTSMRADAEHAEMMRRSEALDWARLCGALSIAETADAPKAARPFRQLLPEGLQRSIAEAADSRSFSAELQAQVRAAVQELVGDRKLFQERAFAGIELSDQADKLLDLGMWRLSEEERKLDKLTQEERAVAALSPEEATRFNWLLLESAFPGQVRQTTWRKAAGVTAVLGNPNLALLLSAAIAMFVLVRQRKLTFKQLGRTTEIALMSGGVIILITAGGGAFGKMLGEAGVKDSVVGFLGTEGQAAGAIMLLTGYAVAAVMKVAQGSSTVSMIVTSAMFAAMGASSEMLGFHPVYLAAAIGCGSLFGSWMNDSGFWIFARMSGFTETEALKSWTILLVVISLTGLIVTLLLATVMPLA